MRSIFLLNLLASIVLQLFTLQLAVVHAHELKPVRLLAQIQNVQPMTGIVLWSTNPAAEKVPIQLEYAYLRYDQVVNDQGDYEWEVLEKLLDDIASRKHQAILRWHDTYVGKPSGVPAHIRALEQYRGTTAKSEGKDTGFPDWSNAQWQSFVMDFFTQFAEKYDLDPRIAFVQVGFGLWAEYHIYDGPMKLGETFPSMEYQEKFAVHLASKFAQTPWMISVDAAGEHAPYAQNPKLIDLPFGVFDDSFNHAKHRQENEPNWVIFGLDRWKRAPAGGEFSFFQTKDQSKALTPNGPHGIPFTDHAARFHVSFIIGDDQPRFQKSQRILQAGQSCGYRFRIIRFDASDAQSEVMIENNGIAPLYHDATPAVNGLRAPGTLKGLLPGESRLFKIQAGGQNPVLTIESDRLVPGQKIEFEADIR